MDKTEKGPGEMSWENIPHHILVKIYQCLSWHDQQHASSTCWAWRGVLLAPVLWKNVKLVLGTKQSNRRTLFLAPCLQHAHFVEILWSSDCKERKRCFTRVLPISKETLKVANEVVDKLCHNSSLESLKIYFNNMASFDAEFSQAICYKLGETVRHNTRLKYLSFGANPFIIPHNIIEIIHGSCAPSLQHLHIATLPPRIGNYVQTLTFQISPPTCPLIVQLECLNHLSIDWKHLTADILRGLIGRRNAVPMQTLQAFLSCSDGCSVVHPSNDDWTEFGKLNADIKIYLVFIYSFEGLCQSVNDITLPVFIKILECQQINVGNFEQIVTWHRDRIWGLAFVNTLPSPVYDPATSLLLAGLIQWCRGLQYLSIIGRFVPAEGVLWMTHNFDLQQHVVSMKHILVAAEASNYLIPISAAKYANFRREMASAMGKCWDALPHIPLEGCYFCDGQDNLLYLTGTLDNIAK